MTRSVRRLMLALAFAWLLLAALSELLVPKLIRDAYDGRSAPVLNRIITGQHENPPEFYVNRWRAKVLPLLVFLAGAGLSAAVLLVEPVQRRLASVWIALDTDPGAAPVPPQPRRRRRIYALIFVLIGGSLFELVRDPPYHRELWPFSQYQMYSELKRGNEATALRLFGVTSGQPPREIPLVEHEYLQPLDHSRLWVSLTFFTFDRDRDRVLRAALGDCLRRYERLRREGRHDGPPLSGVRLYRLRWRLDPWGRNQEPTSRQLLYEVTSSTPATPSS